MPKYRHNNTSMSYLRLAHLSPNAPAVDVSLDNAIVARDVMYGDFSGYLSLKPGQHRLTIYPAGTRDAVLTKTFTVPANSIATGAVYGLLPNIDVMFINDKCMRDPSAAKVRFIHLSPDAPRVDMVLNDSNVLFRNCPYMGVSKHKMVMPGNYCVSLRVAGTNDLALRRPNVSLRANMVYTIYAVGLVGGEPGLELLVIMDGMSAK